MNHEDAEDVAARRAALRKIEEHILGMSGLYTRVGKKLGFDRSYVSRVARGQRYSPIVAKALIDEFEGIMRQSRLPGVKLCPVCRGTGAQDDDPCPACESRGHFLEANASGAAAGDSWASELLHAAIEATRADFGTVQTFDSSQGVLRIAAHRGFGREFLGHFRTVFAGDRCVCGTALKTRTRLLVPDVALHPLFENDESRQVLLRANVRAVQSTPLIAPGGTFIGMVATHYRAPKIPSQRLFKRLDQVTSAFLAQVA